MRERQVCLLVLVACGAGLLAGCTAPSSAVRLTLEFSTMGNYAGHKLEARVVALGGSEVDRESIGAISAAQFAISFSGLEEDVAYRVDFYVDVNDNGHYDAPPTDHAWRIDVPASKGDRSVAFTPGGAFTDIAFPVPPAPGPAADGVISSGEYRHTMTDPTTGMTVWWENDEETLYVGLVAPGLGWLAIGFGPVNKMEGANIIMGYVDGGTLTISDQYGSGPTGHTVDAHSDILTSGGRESANSTTMEFSIPMDSRDAADKELEPGERVAIILSYHLSEDSLTAYHATARATVHIDLD